MKFNTRETYICMQNPFSVGTEEDKAQASKGATEKQERVNDDIRKVPSPKETRTPPEGENRENGKAEVLVETVTHEEIVTVWFCLFLY